MYYDAERLAELDGEARASNFWLSQALKSVLTRQEKEIADFDLLTTSADEARRHQELRTLLAAMQSYCEATDALNQQLSANLLATEQSAQRDSTRAAMFLHQIRLMHEDLKTEQALSLQQLETFQKLLHRGA